jgi:hypothetical protein
MSNSKSNVQPNSESGNATKLHVMGDFSTLHYMCTCGWKGSVNELEKDYEAMECGGAEYFYCPKCKCESGLSLNQT